MQACKSPSRNVRRGGWEELCVEKEVGVKRVEEGRKEEGESNEREGGREGGKGRLAD